MGLFDKSRKEEKPVEFKIENEREAWIVLMYAVASSDDDFSDAEVDYMSRLVVFKSFFTGYDTIPIIRKAIAAKQKGGIDAIINAAIPLISEENKATVLTCAVDLVMADGTLGKKEEKTIETVAEKLRIDATVAEKIIEVMMYKNKYNQLIESENYNDDDD